MKSSRIPRKSTRTKKVLGRPNKVLVRKYSDIVLLIRNFFLLLLIPIIIYLLVYKYKTFDITSINIVGATTYVSSVDMKRVVATSVENKNIFSIDTKELSQNLKDNFQGAKAISISKRPLGKLIITVVEREPLALIYKQTEEMYMVDEDGYVLGLVDKTKNNLPKIRYEEEIKVGYFIDKNFVPVYFELLDSIAQNNVKVSSVSVVPNSIRLFVNEGVEVFLSRSKPTKESVNILAHLLKQLAIEGKNPKKIDLRYDKVIVSYE